MYILSIDFGNSYIKIAIYNPNIRNAKSEYEKVIQRTGDISEYTEGNLPSIVNLKQDSAYVGKTLSSKDYAVYHIKQHLTQNVWIEYILPRQKNMDAVEIISEAYDYLYHAGKACFRADDDFQFDETVVTVPVTFSEMQKHRIREALKCISGHTTIVPIITEPFAGLFSCYPMLEEAFQKQERFHILVFDIGAGTLDMSIFQIDARANNPTITTVVSRGIELAGNYLTELIRSQWLNTNASKDVIREAIQKELDFIQAETGQNDKRNSEAVSGRINQLFNEEADKFKIALCSAPNTPADFIFMNQTLLKGKKYADFESLLNGTNIRRKIEEKLDEMLNIGVLDAKDITKILAIGGTASIPYFRNMLSAKFPNAQFISPARNDNHNAVAVGAGVYRVFCNAENRNFTLRDRVSYEIGVIENESYLMIRSLYTWLGDKTNPVLVTPEREPETGIPIVKMYQRFADSCTATHIPPMPDGLIYMGHFRLDANAFTAGIQYCMSLCLDKDGVLTGIFSDSPDMNPETSDTLPLIFA